ncbi:phosphoesterase [Calycomorphotria hydatis]|uniref:Nudix hydrolase domain-containing protein n=1 Tax=Calycomorphotria hydatis TaxID=2528027 RepID=A0A517TDT0_9PLAN|nr:phosphoesterase [Calycomorphotria hydatis]QDT66524.1 hypothetical protein V22_37940 [Calycomorphotria hydatis]
MAETREEHVLVVPTLLFHEVGYFQGFQPEMRPYLDTLLDPAHMHFMPRSAAEEDPSYKQLIPYCLFVCEGKIYHYTRGKSGGEDRLKAKISIGVGGHVSSDDVTSGKEPYSEGLRRELSEEVAIDSPYTEQMIGLINDDETEVGRVHLGVVHLFQIDEPKVQPLESSMTDVGFMRPEELADQFDRLETWSQICLKHVFLEPVLA